MNKILVWLGILIWITVALAGGNGGHAGSFLRIGLGARGMAMGNAQVASPINGFGFYYNPAGLPWLKDKSANFSYNFLSLDRQFNFIGFSTPLKPHAGFSLGWIYSGVDKIMGYDSGGHETGEINHGLHAFYFSFGIMIIPNRLSAGINAKFLLENISNQEESYKYKGKGFGGDFGVMLRVNSWLSFGYQLKDINASLKSNTDDIFDRGMTRENKFPLSNRVGLYLITPLKWARVAYDFEWSDVGEEKNHLGIELVVPDAALRLGYDNDHFTFGGGLQFTTAFGIRANLNYAFVSSIIDEGVSHIFTWEFAF